ncbi:MAG: hypothetical protein ACI9MR_000693 [Myxococcota bacterium]|jgi:hypothetical protein
MRAVKRFLIVCLIVGFAGQASCNRLGWQLAADIIGSVAQVAIAVAVLASHDAHYHGHSCGHRYIYVEDRPVYEYEGRWEYYDEYDDRWYYYETYPGY